MLASAAISEQVVRHQGPFSVNEGCPIFLLPPGLNSIVFPFFNLENPKAHGQAVIINDLVLQRLDAYFHQYGAMLAYWSRRRLCQGFMYNGTNMTTRLTRLCQLLHARAVVKDLASTPVLSALIAFIQSTKAFLKNI